MTISKLALAAICSTMLASFTAQANDNQFYVQLNGGAALGLAPKGDFGTKKAGTSALFGAEAGYQFDEHLRASVSLDYMSKFSFTDVENQDGANYSTKFKIKSLVAMVNFYYDIIEIKGFVPYVTVGAGIARNQASGTQSVTHSDNTVLVHSVPNGKKINLAWKVGLGTRYNINQNIALDLQYQFADLGKIKTGTNSNFPIANNGKLRAHQFLAGIAYKF